MENKIKKINKEKSKSIKKRKKIGKKNNVQTKIKHKCLVKKQK